MATVRLLLLSCSLPLSWTDTSALNRGQEALLLLVSPSWLLLRLAGAVWGGRSFQRGAVVKRRFIWLVE